MRASRAAVVLFAIAAPVAAAAAIAGCNEGTIARPEYPLVEAGAEDATVVICPNLTPDFASIRTGLLATNSCGSGRTNCHSTTAAQNGVGGGLDYSLDASALYGEFFLPDGGSVVAQNSGNTQANRKPVDRIVPGNPGASLLYIKLTLTTSSDPNYGSGMPYDHPGAVCPATVQVVGDWIDGGAKFESDLDAAARDGALLDASLDAGDAAD